MKKFIVNTMSFFVGRAIKVLYKTDSRMNAEIKTLEGKKVALRIPNAKHLVFFEHDGKIQFCRGESAQKMSAELEINFKSFQVAYEVLALRKSIAVAFCEKSFTLAGDIGDGMTVVRMFELVESYLLPKIWSRKLLKRVEKRERSAISTFIRIIFGA